MFFWTPAQGGGDVAAHGGAGYGDGWVMGFLLGQFFIAYLFGSIPFGFLLTKVFLKKDIRQEGSGNIGATNVLRSGHKLLALATLLLDGSKGIFAALFAGLHIPLSADLHETAIFTMLFVLFVVLGHCFPIWLKFKGGKGVATAFGALLAAVPITGLAAVAVWLITAFAFRYSSLAALLAIGVAPIVTFFVYGSMPGSVCMLITLLVWFRHKSNIKRLIAGTEPKIGQ